MGLGLPAISGKEAVRAFEKAGWKLVRIGSSRHMIMKKKGGGYNPFYSRP